MAPDRSWRLPSLSGKRGKVVLLAYAVTAVMIFVIIAGSFWVNARDFFGNMPTAAEYGFRTRTNDSIPEVASVSRREPGKSELREGDRFLSINGEPLPKDATEFDVAERLDADADGRVTLVTRSEDGAVRSHDVVRRAITLDTMDAKAGLPLWLYIAIGFISAQLPLLAWFGASLFLAWRRPRDSEAMLLAFAFLLLCVTRGSAFWLHAFLGLPWTAIVLTENLAGCFMLGAIAAFPDGRFTNSLSRLALVLVALLAATSIAVSLEILHFRWLDIFALSAVLAVLLSLWRRYRDTADQSQRQQIKWAVFGFCAAMLLFLPVIAASLAGLVPDDGPLPVVLYQVVTQFAWLLLPVGILISLLKYRLYDADAAISRSAAYAALTLALAAIFAGSAEALEWFFQANVGRDMGALPNAIAAGVAVVAFTPLSNRLQRWSEHRFQKNLVSLRRDLVECVEDMREISSLDSLLNTILDKVTAGVRADRAAVAIGRDIVAVRQVATTSSQEWLDQARLNPAAEMLDCDREEEMFPLRLPLRVRHAEEGTFGWLLLGPRPDDSFYGQDEQEALAAISGPISRAIQIVLVREARDAEAERRRAEQDQRLGTVEQELARVMETLTGLLRRGAQGKPT